MAGLYQRVAARGFPSAVIAGQTGVGALESQGSPQDPRHGDVTPGTPGYTTQVLPQFSPDTPADLYIPVGLGFHGLPGTLVNPDQTIATVPVSLPDGTWSRGDHAAPVPGWAPSPNYVTSEADADAMAVLRDNSTEIHGVNFGSLAQRQPNDVTDIAYTAWYSNDPGANVAQPIRGQLQGMGGYDATQGYGGGGPGEGGINAYGLGAPHVDRFQWSEPQPQPYLDPAERPFLAPQGSGSFVPTDAVQSQPYGSFLDGPSVIYSDPSAYSPPPQPATQQTTDSPAPVSTGWWS